METEVTFGNDGTVKEIKVVGNSTTLAYAHMYESNVARIGTVYPFDGCEGIKPDNVGDIVQTVEQLPFIAKAEFAYNK